MYYILRFAQFLISLIPIKILYAIAGFITKLVFSLWKEKRENVYRNYSLVLAKKFGRIATPAEIKKTMNDNFFNYGKFNVEFLYIHKLVRMSNLPEVKHPERIENGLKNGKGLMICTLHFANWDIAGAIISGHYNKKYGVWAIADDLGGGYSKFVQESRARYGIKVVLPNKNLKDAYECLKNNGILNVLIDRPLPRTDKSGVEVDFFGKKAYVASAAARIVLKTGAALLVGCSGREGDTFFGQPGELITYTTTGNKETDIQIVTQALMTEAEKLIMANPEQWYMFRNFWN
ncbi:MAG: hypothetical protein WCJ94_01905 [bacterium]